MYVPYAVDGRALVLGGNSLVNGRYHHGGLEKENRKLSRTSSCFTYIC